MHSLELRKERDGNEKILIPRSKADIYKLTNPSSLSLSKLKKKKLMAKNIVGKKYDI
jgi:hypothetical protein